jgi:hypothetical protein
MKLSEDQLESVAAWFAGGASLDEIQKRLVAEYGVHVTYFDLRMIVAEFPQPEEAEEDARQRVPPEGGEADAQERVPPGGVKREGRAAARPKGTKRTRRSASPPV